MISKTRLKEQIDKFPDENISIDELIERLLFIDKLENRMKDSEKDETLTEEQVENEMKRWFKSNG
jgi:flagellar biosynthesis chaperone FliJ